MLRERKRSDRVGARLKEIQRGRSEAAFEALSHLVPSAESAAAADARIVSGAEEKPIGRICEAFGDRRATILLEGGRIDDAVSNARPAINLRLVVFPIADSGCDLFGSEPSPNRMARQHSAFDFRHQPDLKVDRIVDPEAFYPFMPDIPGVRTADDAGELASVLSRQVEANGANARAQEAVNHFGEVRQLVDQEHMDFGPLVLKPVGLVFNVAQVNLAAVPKSYLVIAEDLREACRAPWGEQRAKAFWPLNMISDQIFSDAAEKVNLQAGNFGAPCNRGDAEQVGFAGTGGAAKQDFRRRTLESEFLARMKMDRELCSLGAHRS